MTAIGKITAKGQTTIPLEIRVALNVKPVDLLAWIWAKTEWRGYAGFNLETAVGRGVPACFGRDIERMERRGGRGGLP
ncbi:MAG TPA: hypothetical protein PLW81_01575 [Thiobacillaceae bacterium]|nr:hypothetical protein [Thiobacillaceae bacterium]